MATPQDVMKMVKENDAKFVDFRFTDTRGKEQHVTVPVSAFDEDKFENGHAFDGSSIAGWKGIQASDMLLMPDPDTAYVDPFFDETTLVLSCDVVDPADGKWLRPRPAFDRQARRSLPEVLRHWRHRLLRSGTRILHFRLASNGTSTCPATPLKIYSEEAAWAFGREDRRQAPPATVRPSRAATSRFRRSTAFNDIRSAMVLTLEALRRSGRSAPPRSGHRRSERNRHQVRHPGSAAPTRPRS